MKDNDRVTLCIAKTSNGTTVPVVIPNKFYTPGEDDILYFKVDGVERIGDILFCNEYETVGETLWNALVAAYGMEPIKATKIAHVTVCDWGDEDDNSAEET
jgi:hypothetical protein